jgi:hypothetical protein
MLGLVGWAFGGHVLFVALVAWAVPVRAGVVDGRALPAERLARAGRGVRVPRPSRMARAAGVAIASAAMLRLFPAVLVALPLVTIAHRTWRRRRLGRFDRRFVAGVVGGAAAWLLVSTAVFGVDAWRAFADHIAVPRLTPAREPRRAALDLRAVVGRTMDGRHAARHCRPVPRVEAPAARDRSPRARRRTGSWPARCSRSAPSRDGARGGSGSRSPRSAALGCSSSTSRANYCAFFLVLGLLAASSRAQEWLALGASC